LTPTLARLCFGFGQVVRFDRGHVGRTEDLLEQLGVSDKRSRGRRRNRTRDEMAIFTGICKR
jgi:hypothetical protein